jgi:hypothetical protein
MNNLALFVTHSIFLTKEEKERLLNKEDLVVLGHCVPVWVDAKTGKTTEPAAEIFCNYTLTNGESTLADVELVPKSGFRISLPKSNWSPPEPIDYELLSSLESAERIVRLKDREKWWFNNPKPPDAENLRLSGYLRFEVKKTKQKTARRVHSTQHVVEISDIERLEESLV